MTDQPGLTYAPGTANGGPDIAGGSGALAVLREAQANGAWRHQDQPAMTITGSADNGNFGWELHTACVEVVRSIDEPAAPGWRGPGDGPRQNAPGSVKLTVEQALTLQGFPPDFPIHGTKTSRFRQIGNAVCPPVAAAILTRLAAHDEAAA
jgi:DNA (cytosine-5)-methyltransferase 1